jgi:hypothetical protein
LNVSKETGWQILPSATGVAAREAIAFLRRHNVPIDPLLEHAGVSEADIDNRQHHISAIAQAKLLEYAAEALGDDEFGLHLAKEDNPREAGLLFYVASAAENIGDAVALYARYCRIVNEAVRLKLIQSPEGVIVETKFVALPRHFAWQNTEFAIATLIKGLREMAGCDVRPTRVTFTLARNSGLAEFERFFGCPVEFSALADQFGFSNETLAIRLVTEDRYLLQTLQPICDAAAKERNHTSPWHRHLRLSRSNYRRAWSRPAVSEELPSSKNEELLSQFCELTRWSPTRSTGGRCQRGRRSDCRRPGLHRS